jgi:hypothetical protein
MSVKIPILPDGSAALNGARSFSRFLSVQLHCLCQFLAPAACPLHVPGLGNPARLAKIIGALPVGRQVRMDRLRAAVGGGFKEVASDLRRLQALPLPIETTRGQWATLTAPVQLCKRCARFAAASASQTLFRQKRRHEGQAGVGCCPTQIAGRSTAVPRSS